MNRETLHAYCLTPQSLLHLHQYHHHATWRGQQCPTSQSYQEDSRYWPGSRWDCRCSSSCRYSCSQCSGFRRCWRRRRFVIIHVHQHNSLTCPFRFDCGWRPICRLWRIHWRTVFCMPVHRSYRCCFCWIPRWWHSRYYRWERAFSR